jgi:hypothetical protein
VLKLVLAAAVSIGLLAGAAAAATGDTAPISSLSTLPPLSKPLSPDLKTAIAREAANIRLDARTALRRTRLLRNNVNGLPLYAFSGANNSVCFLVWHGAGACGQLAPPTKIFYVYGGGSRKRGQAVVGIASDAVVAVKVRINKTWHRVRPLHNAFFVPYRSPSASVTVVALTQ